MIALLLLSAQLRAVPPVFNSELRELGFPNGMRAVVARTPAVPGRAPRVFVGLYLRYGTSTARRPELAHLVEHVAANNSPTVVDYQIPPQLTQYGGNAMTRPDYMSFWRTVAPEGLEAILASRVNRVLGVKHDPTVFTTQVGRVAAETERTIARIEQEGPGAGDLLPAAMTGPRVPLGARLDTLRSFDTTTVYRDIERYFRPDLALLVVAGDIDVASTVDLIRRRVAALGSRSGPRPLQGSPLVPRTGPLVVRDSRAMTTRVGIGFPLPGRRDPDFLAALVVDQLLLGGRSEPSDSAVHRSDDTPFGRHLASSLGARGIDDGVFYSTDPPPLAQRSPAYLAATFSVADSVGEGRVIAGVNQALRAATTIDLTDAAIARARAELVDFMGRWMMSPDLLPLGDHLAAFTFIDGSASRLRRLPREINALSAAQVRRVAARYFGPNAARIVVVVPDRR